MKQKVTIHLISLLANLETIIDKLCLITKMQLSRLFLFLRVDILYSNFLFLLFIFKLKKCYQTKFCNHQN